MAFLTLPEIEAERLALLTAYLKECQDVTQEWGEQEGDIPSDVHATFRGLKDVRARRGSDKYLHALQAFDTRRKAAFYKWCADPNALTGEERSETLNWVTSHVQSRASKECPPISVLDKEEALAALPASLPELREYCLMSCESWWYRAAILAGNVQEFDPSNGGNIKTSIKYHAGAYVNSTDHVIKNRHVLHGTTMDGFTYRRYGANFTLQAVIEHWCEPSDESIVKVLEKEPAFLDLLKQEYLTSSLDVELQKRLLPANPTVVRHAQHCLDNGRRILEPAGDDVPKYGVLIRSFVVAPHILFAHGESATDQFPKWDVFSQLDLSSRFMTETVLEKVANVVLAYKEWVTGLGLVPKQKSTSGRNRASLRKEYESDIITEQQYVDAYIKSKRPKKGMPFDEKKARNNALRNLRGFGNKAQEKSA